MKRISTATLPAWPRSGLSDQDAPGQDSPLALDQQRELLAATKRVRKIHGATKLATFNGWTLALAAVCSLPLALGGGPALLIAPALAGAAFNEFRGRAMLHKFDPRGGRVLGWNQLAVIGLVTAYCAWKLHTGLNGEGPFAEEIRQHPELADMLGGGIIGALHRTVTIAIYATLIAATMIFQGLLSRYYFSRAKLLADHLAQTPAWILDLQSKRVLPGA